MKARALLLIPVLAVFVMSGCGVGTATGRSKYGNTSADTPVAASHGGPVRDYVSFVDHLRGVATVTPAGNIERSFFSVGGYAVTVGAETIQVYEYADEAAMATDARTVSPDGSTVGHTMVSWIAPPHFYKAGRIIVVYAGSDATTLQRLTQILGAQFAGK